MIAPETRLTAVLLGSLFVWSPALLAALAGELPAEVALFRFLLVLGAVWLMVTALDRVVGGYARTAAAEAAATATEAPPRRRRDDAPDEGAPGSEVPDPALMADETMVGQHRSTDDGSRPNLPV